MTGVAHVSFHGGGIFLPDHGPGDRQTIVDYVARLTHSQPAVQILLENQRWMAQSDDHICCDRCGCATNVSCRESSNEAESYCLRCALAGYVLRPARAARMGAAQHLAFASASA